MLRDVSSVIRESFTTHRQMAFLIGPRQSGKTWIARSLCTEGGYLSWDIAADRQAILDGGPALATRLGLDRLRENKPIVCFDELHKFPRWKDFLKGFFDRWEDRCSILVTGSAALDAFSRGGDSLMGRYFTYRCNPLGWREVLADPPPGADSWERFIRLGGFPEPFLTGETGFWRRWKNSRWQQLFREELRDLTRSLELQRIETLGTILLERATGRCVWSTLAARLQVSEETIRRWVSHLEALHTIFLIRPWTRNVGRSILKEPKVYFSDWSWIKDEGARAENLVAAQLKSQLELWEDSGLGEFGLWYLRDKDGHEADFLVSRDDEPWILVEVKKSGAALAEGLRYWPGRVTAPHNFQLVMDLPPVDSDPFSAGSPPLIVPAQTFFARWQAPQA